MNEISAYVMCFGLAFSLDAPISSLRPRVDLTDGLDGGTQLMPGKPSLPGASSLSSQVALAWLCKHVMNL